MRYGFLFVLLTTLLLSGCGTSASTTGGAASAGKSFTLGALQISNVWSRPAVGMSGMDAQPTGAAAASMEMSSATGAVYLTIRNTGGTPDRLTNVQIAIAGSSEVHSMTMNGGVMKMDPVAALDVPANGEVTLDPNGLHVMMIGLRRDLKLGDIFDVKLQFEHAGAVTVQAEVRAR